MGAQNAAEVERLREALASLVGSQVLGASAFAQSIRYEIADSMIAAGVWLPPEGATRTEGRAIAMTPDLEPMPYADREITHTGEGAYVRDALGYERDVTDEINAWASRQPAVIVVTYEWPEPVPVCPDCRDGKHAACGGHGVALGYDDEIVPCRCDHGGAS